MKKQTRRRPSFGLWLLLLPMLLFLACLLRPTSIRWPAAMLRYSGYGAEEHLQEFQELPDKALLFTRVDKNADGSLTIRLSAWQRMYYRHRYRKMLGQAAAACEGRSVRAEAGENYRKITYYAENFEDFLAAGISTQRFEAFASCLQAERNGSEDAWELQITIVRPSAPEDPVCTFTVPGQEMTLTREMWEEG